MKRRHLLGVVIGYSALGLGGCNTLQEPYDHRKSGVLETEEPIFECCTDWSDENDTTDFPTGGKIISTESENDVVYWDKMRDEYSMFAQEFMYISYDGRFLVTSTVKLGENVTIVGSESTFEDGQMVQTLKIAPRKVPRDGAAYNNRFELWGTRNQEPPTELTVEKEYLDTPIGEKVED